jgi:hypothetical protein
MPRPPMVITPAKQVLAHDGTVQVHVIDTSAKPLQVTTDTVLLSNHCATQAGTHDVTVSPAAFIVQPGHGISVSVTVHAGSPAGDYAARFFGTTVTGKTGPIGQVQAIGSRVVTGGKPVNCITLHLAAAAHAASGFPVLPLALGLLIVAGIIGGLFVRLRKRPLERHLSRWLR